MCGRFAFENRKSFSSRYKIKLVIGTIHENYNTAPGMDVPVIIKGEEGNEVIKMKWGLLLGFPKPGQKPFAPINAKSETVLEKPIFSHLLGNRCVIPVIGFYEWQKNGAKKQPFFIHMKDEEYFSLAGIYKTIKDDKGEDLSTFTILTTKPNSLMQNIHDRMPVILKREDEEKWLNNETKLDFNEIFESYNPEEMDAYEVSSLVNSPRNRDKDLINPIQ